MIPKGNQRGGGQNLATHLLNSFDNEQVQIAEVRGAVAPDLHGAFAEWRAQAKLTHCEKYLYSLSLNPDHRQGPFERKDYLEFLDRAEKKMGLAGQPRAVVFHTKEGREHCHAVWSRIDTGRMKAIPMSHDRQKLRSVAQDFARDHGITLPEGMRRQRGTERFNDRAKRTNLAENQQKERTGERKEDRVTAVTKAWRESDTAAAFQQALAERGYQLARGDRRAIVIVDRYGEIHSLTRQIEGVKAAELKTRLGKGETLPELAAARETAMKFQERSADAKKAEQARAERLADIDRRRARMLDEQARRRQQFGEVHRTILGQHAGEGRALSDLHQADNDRRAAFRAANQPKGLRAFLVRVTGIQARADRRHEEESRARAAEQQRQRAATTPRRSTCSSPSLPADLSPVRCCSSSGPPWKTSLLQQSTSVWRRCGSWSPKPGRMGCSLTKRQPTSPTSRTCGRREPGWGTG